MLSIGDQNLLTFLPSILFDRAITLLIPSLMDWRFKMPCYVLTFLFKNSSLNILAFSTKN